MDSFKISQYCGRALQDRPGQSMSDARPWRLLGIFHETKTDFEFAKSLRRILGQHEGERSRSRSRDCNDVFYS
jgi:hypothetical protein